VSHDLNPTSAFSGSYKANAIILISGNSGPEAIQIVLDILSEYNLKLVDQQSINMAGRLIAAMQIEFDPAHADAIERELLSAMKPLGLDVALEVL
jgi:predicted amino acid-binding ACT domain protein